MPRWVAGAQGVSVGSWHFGPRDMRLTLKYSAAKYTHRRRSAFDWKTFLILVGVWCFRCTLHYLHLYFILHVTDWSKCPALLPLALLTYCVLLNKMMHHNTILYILVVHIIDCHFVIPLFKIAIAVWNLTGGQKQTAFKVVILCTSFFKSSLVSWTTLCLLFYLLYTCVPPYYLHEVVWLLNCFFVELCTKWNVVVLIRWWHCTSFIVMHWVTLSSWPSRSLRSCCHWWIHYCW